MSRPPLDPALDGVLLTARDRREQRGWAGDATIVLGEVTSEEALALDGLLAVSTRRRAVLPGKTLRLRLSELEAALRACSIDPWTEYERVGGRDLRDLPAERAAARHAREDFRRWLQSHDAVVRRPALAKWLEQALGQGRLHSGMRPLVESALHVVAALPSSSTVQRTVLAARLLHGDPHALDVGTPLHGLVMSLLIAEAGLASDASARDVWARFNVLVDPVSSNAMTLGLPLLGDGVAARMVRAARGGHAILSYGQLRADELIWPSSVGCFTCENPSVLVEADRLLGRACAPLICTSGYPSDAVRLLLSAIAQAGGQIRHHGDFDDAGMLIMRDLRDRYGALPWRFDLASLNRILAASSHSRAASSRASFDQAVAALPNAVPEELLLDELLGDLRVQPENSERDGRASPVVAQRQ